MKKYWKVFENIIYFIIIIILFKYMYCIIITIEKYFNQDWNKLADTTTIL